MEGKVLEWSGVGVPINELWFDWPGVASGGLSVTMTNSEELARFRLSMHIKQRGLIAAHISDIDISIPLLVQLATTMSDKKYQVKDHLSRVPGSTPFGTALWYIGRGAE